MRNQGKTVVDFDTDSERLMICLPDGAIVTASTVNAAVTIINKWAKKDVAKHGDGMMTLEWRNKAAVIFQEHNATKK